MKSAAPAHALSRPPHPEPSRRSRWFVHSVALLSAASLPLVASSVRAANTSDIFISGTELSTGANWSTGAVPAVNDDAQFTTASPSGALTLTASTLTVGSLDDTNTGTTTSITNPGGTASQITLGGSGDLGNGTAGSAAADLIYVSGMGTFLSVAGSNSALNLVLGQAGSFDVASGAALNLGTAGLSTLTNGGFLLTLSGAGTANIGNSISGTGGLSQTGAGTTTLSGTNTFSGTTTIAAGTLNIGANTTLSGAVTLNGSGTLNLGGTTQTVSNLALGTVVTGQSSVITNGSLTVTGAAGVTIEPVANSTAATTVDLSGLTNFTYNQAGESFLVSNTYPATGTDTQFNVTLKLAGGTNNITAALINVGSTGHILASETPTPTATLTLGQTNNFNTASFQIGGYNIQGALAFATGLTAPTLTLRGTAGGVTPATTFYVGFNNAAVTAASSLDTTAGSIDAIATSTYLGYTNAGSSPTTTATLSLTGGTLNTGILYFGDNINTTAGITPALVSTINQNGGTVLASTATFGLNSSATSTPTFNGTYNLGPATGTATAGLLSAQTIGIGGGGRNTASRAVVNFNNGTIENYDPALGQSGSAGAAGGSTTAQNLTISGLSGGGAGGNSTTLNMVLAATGTHNFLAESGFTITEAATALISGTGALTVNGAGGVILNGQNTYSGGTNITAGILTAATTTNTTQLGTGNVSISASAQLTINTGVTLNMTGTSLTLASTTTSIVNLAGAGIQDMVSSLIVNGMAEPNGTYGSGTSGAANTSIADFTGSGELMVVPEPSTWAALLAGLGGLAALMLFRKRDA